MIRITTFWLILVFAAHIASAQEAAKLVTAPIQTPAADAITAQDNAAVPQPSQVEANQPLNSVIDSNSFVPPTISSNSYPPTFSHGWSASSYHASSNYYVAPHVEYGSGLGYPDMSFRSNGAWYSGTTWGLFPKHHRANRPRFFGGPHGGKSKVFRGWHR